MPTRVVFLCDSDPRPPSRLGRADEALWARLGSSGVGVLGARGGQKDLQNVSHGVFTEGVEEAQAWNKTEGELRLCRGGVQIAIVTASEKKAQHPDSQADFYF